MLAQSVQTQKVSVLFAGYRSKSPTFTEHSKSFDDMLQSRVSPEQTEETKEAVQKEEKKMLTVRNTDQKTDAVAKKSEKTDVSETEKAADTRAQTTEGEEEDATEYAKKVVSLISQVVEIINRSLGLTKEQTEQILQEAGLSEQDLLDPKELKVFFLSAKQEETTVLLTDAKLLGEFNRLAQEVTEKVQEVQLPAELMTTLSKLSEENNNAAGDVFLQGENALVTEDDLTQKPDGADVLTQTKEKAVFREVTLTFKTETQASETTPWQSKKESLVKEPEQLPEYQFLQNLQKALEPGIEPADRAYGLTGQIREIADQLLETVRVVVSDQTTSLEIQLTPEHLGKVQLTVSEQDGVLKAKFFTENELSKEAIERNLVQFKETLNEQGLKVESIEVMVSEFSFDKNGQAGQSGHKEGNKGKRQLISEEIKDAAAGNDRVAEHFMLEGESTVIYKV